MVSRAIDLSEAISLRVFRVITVKKEGEDDMYKD